METSEQINELATALSKAQGKITGALKDSSNPFFKSKYADLASCWDACRAPLSDCGLAVIQTTQDGESGTMVVTRLVHSSGQWVQGRLTLAPKDHGPQAIGSTLTYARRYALAAIVGLAQIDDDAEAATGRQVEWQHPPEILTNEKRDKFLPELVSAINASDAKRINKVLEALTEGQQKGIFSFLSGKQKASMRDLLQAQATTPADLERAGEYATRFKDALQSEADEALKELHRECMEKPDFYMAVSALLTPAERDSIKSLVRRNGATKQ
jgi:hypothetical protein